MCKILKVDGIFHIPPLTIVYIRKSLILTRSIYNNYYICINNIIIICLRDLCLLFIFAVVDIAAYILYYFTYRQTGKQPARFILSLFIRVYNMYTLK